MYSKDEKAKMRHAFWTAFGMYMSGVPIFDEEGKKKNWLNYKTGVRGVQFKSDASEKHAYIAIELQHKSKEERKEAYKKFLTLRKLLNEKLGEEWLWEENYEPEFGKPFSRIYKEIDGMNIFKKEEWPNMISFFKPRILALDAFWEDVKPLFEE